MWNLEIPKHSRCLHNIKDTKKYSYCMYKVFSHFTEKSVVRKHIKSDNVTLSDEGEKSFWSALIMMHVFSLKGSFILTLLIWIFFVKSERTANSNKNIQINTKFDLDKLNECMRVRNLTSAMFVTWTLFKIPIWTPISKLRMKIRNQVHHLFSEELHFNSIHAKTYFMQHHVNYILWNNLTITFIFCNIIIRLPKISQ